MVIHRGDLYWAALPEPAGSGPGYRRPVLVLQSDDFSASAIRTVIVAAVSTNLRLAAAPGNVLCRRRETRLPRDSVVNVSQVLTIDKSLLAERVGRLPAPKLREVEEGLRLVLQL
jgi:mRNA interferase MazF